MKSLFGIHVFASIVGFILAQENATVKVAVDNMRNCSTLDKSKFDQCLLVFWTDIRPHLAVGIPELKVPPLDPLDIGVLEFPRDGSVIQGEASFRDLLVGGMGNYSIQEAINDVAKQTITVKLSYPALRVDGSFHFDGNVFLLPIKGDGPLKIELDDVEATLVASIERDGTGAGLILKRVDIDFTSKMVKLTLKDFLGDGASGGEASTAINNLINDNSQVFFREVKPLVRVKIGDALTKVLTGIVRELPSEPFI